MKTITDNPFRQKNIRRLGLIVPLTAVLMTWPAPHLNSGIDALQAAVGKLPPARVPAPEEMLLHRPTAATPVLPKEVSTVSVPVDQPPEIHHAITAASAPPADGQDQPEAVTCDLAECKFFGLVVRVSKRHRVEPALIAAIIKAESGYNPKAISHKGARGMMQLMPLTAAEMGVENSFNPEHNIRGGVRYYKKLLKRYKGNVELALAAYNAGMQAVKKYNGVPPFETTRRYIKKVLHYYQVYKKTLLAVESIEPA